MTLSLAKRCEVTEKEQASKNEATLQIGPEVHMCCELLPFDASGTASPNGERSVKS